MKKNKIVLFVILLILTSTFGISQNNIDELHGDRKNRKQGLHNGNLVETLFWNFGQVGWWGKPYSGVWPRGTQHSYMDGIYPIVAAEVNLINGDTIHIVEGGYREHFESGPTGVEFGWQPLPGFSNPDQDYIAMNDNPNSWPDYWPDKPADWGGYWNGYFGKRANADQESYFVCDDYQDQGRDFYKLFYCDKNDSLRGGLGMRTAVRGFQWSNVLAEDIIFWHYNITNVSTTNYNKAIFGMYCDAGVGGQNDSNDDMAGYDLDYDIAYTWDSNGIGEGGWDTGYAGYAFLESPGNPFDGIDNDNDGIDGTGQVFDQTDFNPKPLGDVVVLIDYSDMAPKNNWGRIVTSFSEGGNGKFWSFSGDSLTITANNQEYKYCRGNTVSEKPYNGIDEDLDGIIDENEEAHIGLKYRNWITSEGFDNLMIDETRNDLIDNDNDWDINLDDVGVDGLSGTGDFGEGDGVPTSGEPHFDQTDKDESDQIGLTSFDSFRIGQGVEYRYDEVIWERISNYHFDTETQNGNIAFLFGSGPFIMPPDHTERFSLALVFGENLQDIKRNKKIVQDIYNANYNFARPPIKPKVSVVPGDRKVTLYWDDLAETSYDEFADPVTGGYDFEGYAIFKATDAAFNDVYNITNGYGEAAFHKPEVQFDLKNGVKGFFNIDVHGIKYYLGNDSGLKHSWTDYDVTNGETYYYAVVSYDRGWREKNILPSSCTKVIFRDINDNIILDQNTIEVVPSVPVAGYKNPQLQDNVRHIEGFGTGKVTVDIIDPHKVTNSEYLLTFDDTTYTDTTVYSLFEISGSSDTVTVFEESTALDREDSNPLFNGIRIKVENDSIAFNDSTTGWISGNSNIQIYAELDSYWDNKKVTRDDFPVNYEIRIGVPDSSFIFSAFRYLTNFQVWDVVNEQDVRYYLWEPSDQVDSVLSAGDHIELWLRDGSMWRKSWFIYFVAPEGEQLISPITGDIASIGINLPFRSNDKFRFSTIAEGIDEKEAKSQLSNIAVVPNPYIAAASWEPPRLTASGRGERILYFIHLPQKSTIRVYTMSGELVNILHHNSTMNDGSFAWNMLTKDGLDLAPGVYFYHVDSGKLGNATGKFAIVK